MNTQAARGVFIILFGIAVGKAIAPFYATAPAESVAWAAFAIWMVTTLGVMELVLSPTAMELIGRIERRFENKEGSDVN